MNPFFVLPVFIALLTFTTGARITVKNNCRHSVWVGVNGQREGNEKKWSDPEQGGFELKPKGQQTLFVEVGWAGRLWGRTGCKFSNEQGECETGRCGTNLRCSPNSGEPPVTLAELTLDQRVNGQLMDFYDVSLVDGFNLRMKLVPKSGSGCKSGECSQDMNQNCPGSLQKRNKKNEVVACDSKGGVQEFRDYAKNKCPNAYGYWNDDTKTFACRTTNPGASNFDVIFC